MTHRVLARLAACSLGVAANAQTIWNVPPMQDVGAVIAAASPGDVIVLQAQATYPVFAVTKGVTIRGNNAIVSWTGTGGVIDVAVPPNQVAHLHELDLRFGVANPLQPFFPGTRIQALSGTVRIESCTYSVWQTGVMVAGGDVTMIGCTMGLTSGTCVTVTGGRLTLRDCAFTAGNAICDPHTNSCSFGWHPARPALTVSSGTLHAERVTLRGGSHPLSQVVGNGESALVVTSSRVWLADSSLHAGSSLNGVARPALVVNGSPPAELANVQLFAGSPAGAVSTGAVSANEPLVRLRLTTPWTRGATSTLLVAGTPAAPYGILLAPDATGSSLPFVEQPVLAVSGAPIVAGLLSAAGDASYAVNVPALPALLHATVWCQAFSGTSLPLDASTIAGSLVR